MASEAASTSAATAGGLAKRYRPAPAKTFQCRGFGDCRMVFSRSEHLARHVRKHTGERPFTCHCSKQFSRLDNLRQHAQTVHADKSDDNDRMMRELTTLHATMAGGTKGRRGGGAAPSSAAYPTRDSGTPPKQVKLEDEGSGSDGDVDMELNPGERMMIDTIAASHRASHLPPAHPHSPYDYEYMQRPRPGTTAGYEAGHSISPEDENARHSFRRHFRDSPPTSNHSFRDSPPHNQQSFRGMYDSPSTSPYDYEYEYAMNSPTSFSDGSAHGSYHSHSSSLSPSPTLSSFSHEQLYHQAQSHHMGNVNVNVHGNEGYPQSYVQQQQTVAYVAAMQRHQHHQHQQVQAYPESFVAIY